MDELWGSIYQMKHHMRWWWRRYTHTHAEHRLPYRSSQMYRKKCNLANRCVNDFSSSAIDDRVISCDCNLQSNQIDYRQVISLRTSGRLSRRHLRYIQFDSIRFEAATRMTTQLIVTCTQRHSPPSAHFEINIFQHNVLQTGMC